MESTNTSQKKSNKNRSLPIFISLLILVIIIAAALSFYIFKPTVTLNGDASMQIEVFDEFSDPGATASVHKKDISDQIRKSGSVDTSKIGEYTLKYKVKYFINSTSAKRLVTVSDTTPPELTLKGGNSFTVNRSSNFNDPGFSASDAYDGDLSDKVTTEGNVKSDTPGEYTITYTVYDSSGNKTSTERIVKVTEQPVNGSIIYLTFDDGPGSYITPRNLDILKRNGIPATFYILNYSESQLPIIKRELDEGHAIGIHGYSHDYSKIYTAPEVAMDNFTKLKDKLFADTGYSAYTFRFPGGSSNTISRRYCPGIMSKLTVMMDNAGYSYMDWNVSSGDATANGLSSSAIISNVTSALRPNRANVVLMHDSDSKGTTTEALQAIIDFGREHGYTFASIPPGMTPIHHGVNN